MRYPVLISLLFIFVFSSCKKDKFNTIPALKFESVNTRDLYPGEQLQFTLSFTDAEGDVSNNVYIEEIAPGCAQSSFKDTYTVPDFPSTKNQKGEMKVIFGYNISGLSNISPKCMRNDTAIFRFALQDKAMNVSDTIDSPPIILHY
ncbi:MAG: hypothetical protein ABIR19_06980 [Ginsengibacter sp.]